MTIEYFATRIAKHISVQAIWPDGRTEIIAVLPRDALSGLVTRNNQLIHKPLTPWAPVTKKPS